MGNSLNIPKLSHNECTMFYLQQKYTSVPPPPHLEKLKMGAYFSCARFALLQWARSICPYTLQRTKLFEHINRDLSARKSTLHRLLLGYSCAWDFHVSQHNTSTKQEVLNLSREMKSSIIRVFYCVLSSKAGP